MSLRAFKDTAAYQAFRRFRHRLRERLRRASLALDAWTGARRLRRASLAALVASDETALRALAELVAEVRRMEAARQAERAELLAALEALSARLGAVEELLLEARGAGEGVPGGRELGGP